MNLVDEELGAINCINLGNIVSGPSTIHLGMILHPLHCHLN